MTTPVFNKISVPLDGSAIAEQALPVAATIARESKATLYLTMVRPSLAEPMPFVGSAEEAEALDQETQEQQEAYLASLAADVAARHGVEAVSTILELHDGVAETLASAATEQHIDLVVMTTHGHGGLNRFWLGSVADRLLRCITVPVLLLRAQSEEEMLPGHEFRSVVVALDGTPEAERALGPAIALGSLARDAHYTLLQVIEPPISLITRLALEPERVRPRWRERQEQAVQGYLQRTAKQLREQELTVETEIVTDRGVGDAIVGFAARQGSDLIAIGTRGARGMERLVLGSVADKVVRGATQAVLVVPPPMERP